MNVLNKIRDLPLRLIAYASVIGFASEAHAAAGGGTGGIGTVADRVTGQFQQLGNLVVVGSFLTGFGFSAAGLMKLKQAADSGGQQVKYGEGLWRLGVGAGLVALPAVTNTGYSTFWDNNTSATVGTAQFTAGQ